MDMFKMMKEAAAMRSRLTELDKELRGRIIEVSESGVDVKINGKSEITDVRISDEAFNAGREKVEKRVLEAVQRAVKKSQEMMAEEAKKLTGGMKVPGLTQ
ncbi:MAG: YbaB/EbfC family nucleoid-associated protein [Endomicrobiales bacterium]|nr:YbaB/EbfC family nucleoid-associated protein [Endomicrobiales bacterium]